MKLGNTTENKAKFIMQYYGQKALCNEINHLRMFEVCIASVDFKHIQNDYLLLTPLSQITDEDVIDGICLLNNYYTKSSFNNIEKVERYDGFICFTCKIDNISHVMSFHYHNSEYRDFIRSKGYAVPFMGLSVEDLVNYGWIKLKQ